MGSRTSLMTEEEAYILGLWCADGYHRTSSVGLSNVNLTLIDRFAQFLREQVGRERLRLRVYLPPGVSRKRDLENICERVVYCNVFKAAQISYHVYVNSRPLLRYLRGLARVRKELPDKLVTAYFAGRFDGDGSVGFDGRRDCRIAYGNAEDAVIDREMLERVRGYRLRIYRYQKA